MPAENIEGFGNRGYISPEIGKKYWLGFISHGEDLAEVSVDAWCLEVTSDHCSLYRVDGEEKVFEYRSKRYTLVVRFPYDRPSKGGIMSVFVSEVPDGDRREEILRAIREYGSNKNQMELEF
jgi:hypothetical protein